MVNHSMFISREVTTKGLVVARASAGEGSVRVSLYTDSLGLIVAVAKSAREERSKLRAHLQVGTFGTFTLVKGKDVWRVTGATETQNIHFLLSEKNDAQESAARVLATIRQFVHGEARDPYLFSVLYEFFSSLTGMKREYISEAECLAVLRILSALGYVRRDGVAKEFLPVSYDSEVLARAEGARGSLVRTINEAITASGL